LGGGGGCVLGGLWWVFFFGGGGGCWGGGFFWVGCGGGGGVFATNPVSVRSSLGIFLPLMECLRRCFFPCVALDTMALLSPSYSCSPRTCVFVCSGFSALTGRLSPFLERDSQVTRFRLLRGPNFSDHPPEHPLFC